MSDVAAALSATANWIMAFAAAGGAIAAFMGLNTWQRQIKWQADRDLAKEVLLAIYKFRDSLYAVRHPAMSQSEMQLGGEEKEKIVADGDRSAGIINAYANRWDRHSASRNLLDAVLLETDAVWGCSFRKLVKPLKDLEHELYVYISLHIDAHLRGDNELAQSVREILKDKRNILYDLLDVEKDEFRKDFEDQLSKAEGYLRQKLEGK